MQSKGLASVEKATREAQLPTRRVPIERHYLFDRRCDWLGLNHRDKAYMPCPPKLAIPPQAAQCILVAEANLIRKRIM